jgi:Polyketide cyclase / dehydrase and lipid transport
MQRRVLVDAWIDHPVERVFAYLEDPPSWREFAPAVEYRRQIDRGPVGIGTRWAAIDRIGPFRVRFVDRLAEHDPNRRVVWDSSAPWNARVTYTCEPDRGGTRVHATYEGDPRGWLLGPLGVIVPDFLAAWILGGDFRRLQSILDVGWVAREARTSVA